MDFLNNQNCDKAKTEIVKCMSYVVLAIILCVGQLYAQKSVETINKQISFKNTSAENIVIVKNINGPIDVSSYNGTTIQIEIKKTISASSQANLEKGKQEFKVKIIEKEHEIIVRPDAPYICFDETYHGMNVNMGRHGNKVPYEFELSYTIKVPKNLSIDVSTINHGDVNVNNVQAPIIKVGNINGSIRLKNVAGATEAHTINGKIDINYAQNPVKKSSYSTINGDITINYQKNLAADVSFKSMHGELYTDFTISDYISSRKKNMASKKRGVKYSYSSKPIVRIGTGGTQLDFKTLNGDVSIKKI